MIANKGILQLGLPKGRMEKRVIQLMNDAGINVQAMERTYRPVVSLDGVEAKILKPHDIVEMLSIGSRDLGFAGADWVSELELDLVDLLDTNLDPVRMVVAAPESILENGKLPQRRLIVASEYQRLTQNWIDQRGINAKLFRCHGSTEVFPPEDADCVVDITQTGSTLRANKLVIVEELMRSSTRLYASRQAMDDPEKRAVIDHIVVLIGSVLEARKRVMLEVNVDSENLESVIEVLPCLREPTISPLHGNGAFAIKAAVPKSEIPSLIPEIKARGGTGIVVMEISQLVS